MTAPVLSTAIADFARSLATATDEAIVGMGLAHFGMRCALRNMLKSGISFGPRELREMLEAEDRYIEVITAAAQRRCLELPEDTHEL